MSKSVKSVKDVYDVGHFDFMTSTLSMMFQGMWALILALLLALIRISVLISAHLDKLEKGAIIETCVP